MKPHHLLHPFNTRRTHLYNSLSLILRDFVFFITTEEKIVCFFPSSPLYFPSLPPHTTTLSFLPTEKLPFLTIIQIIHLSTGWASRSALPPSILPPSTLPPSSLPPSFPLLSLHNQGKKYHSALKLKEYFSFWKRKNNHKKFYCFHCYCLQSIQFHF